MGRTAAKNNNKFAKGAEALDWDEAMKLVANLVADEHYREAMLIACGCFLGLRISDILHLRWCDVMEEKTLKIVEKKTGNTRQLKVNTLLAAITDECIRGKDIRDVDTLIFTSQMSGWRKPMTRQRAFQLLKKIADKYTIKSAQKISTHTLRKTFGRRVWLQAVNKGRGEYALQLLSDVFGHSSIQITKRYLGITQSEILSVYDTLT